jgi:hypothetical protein
MKDDAKIASIGRELAAALSAAGYERREDEKQQVRRLMVALCAAVRAEMIAVVSDD